MKRLSVILMAALSIALFSCNQESNEDGNTEQIVKMSTDIYVQEDGSKSGIDGHRIEWDLDDKFYTFGTNKNDVLTEFNVNSIDSYTGHANISATYDLNVSNDLVPRIMKRKMFYLGGFEKTKPMPQTGDEAVTIGMSIKNQTGMFEDIGKYQVIQTVGDPLFKLDMYGTGLPIYDFDRTTFQSLSSIVKLDLSKYVGSEVSVSYNVEEEGICVCNAFQQIYYDNTTYTTKDGLYNEIYEQSEYIEGDVTVSAQVGDTYLVLLPQIEWVYNTEMVFSVGDDVIGRVNFPNGIKQNRIYTGPDGAPIQIGTKSVIEEVEIF